MGAVCRHTGALGHIKHGFDPLQRIFSLPRPEHHELSHGGCFLASARAGSDQVFAGLGYRHRSACDG